MSETTTQSTKNVLDDVMMSMDIVDTLRRDRELVERELNNTDRRKELIERLRDIYQEQGIEVPDHVLEQGVKALEDDRFVYEPQKDSFAKRIAHLYVTRGSWGRWVLGGLAGILIAYGLWYGVVERPRLQGIAAQKTELTQTIPANVTRLDKDVAQIAVRDDLRQRAATLKTDALAAAQTGDAATARAKAGELAQLASQLKRSFKIRIVTRQGELSGVWRIPRNNRGARNFYLIVEAVDPAGNVLTQPIKSEETGKTVNAKKWAIRVPKSVIDAVRDDKADDGIIQKALVGEKKRGVLEPEWFVTTSGGTITEW